jgi:photosystem II stability/assembly factor-like uncharacterized protein
MKKQLLSTLFIFTFLFASLAQESINWRTSTLNSNSNYFDIVSKARANLKNVDITTRKGKKAVKQFERWADFWKERILPNGAFVSEMHTVVEFEKVKQLRNEGFLSKAQATSWSLIGPTTRPNATVDYYAGMGRINTVAFNGADVNTLYIAAASGGVWKSTDGGTTWTAKGDNLPNIGVSDIVINPSNTSVVYLATGDYDGIHTRSVGVYKSTNGGDSWSATGLTFTLGDNNIIGKLLIDPNNVNIIFATTKNSIKRSIDGGANWTNVHTENGATFNDIQYKRGSSTTIFATARNGKFYISTNNGTTWTSNSTPSTGRTDLALTDNDTNLLMLLDEGGVLRKSTNDGASWTTVSTITGYDSQGAYNMTLAVSPLDKNLILAGGIEGWRSKNGGTTWEKYLDGYWETGQPYFYVHSDHHDMMFVPSTNIAFSTNDGGIFKGDASINMPWTDLSNGLAITQYYAVAGTPQNANYLIMGAQDNDVVFFDGTKWDGKNPGSDGVEALWDYSTTNVAWTCSQQGGLERTTDGFATSQQITTPAGAPFIWELEIHPTTPTTIYGGFGDIYKSTDRGDNWTNLNSGAGEIEFISISPSNPDIIFVVGQNGFKKTVNGGTSWTDVTEPGTGTIKSIEVHPTNPSEIYVNFSGYTTDKVWKSTDSGANWTDITGSLPNVPTHKIIYKTGSTDGELFLATDLGVFYRTNTKGDWVQLGTGLPNVIVKDIEIHYGSEKLRAATFGRGLWEISITSTALGVEEKELPLDAVLLYPNPTTNKSFTIQLNGLNGESTIRIYNLVGSVVKEFTTDKSKEEVNLNKFAQGMYLVKVTNNDRSSIKRVIVK